MCHESWGEEQAPALACGSRAPTLAEVPALPGTHCGHTGLLGIVQWDWALSFPDHRQANGLASHQGQESDVECVGTESTPEVKSHFHALVLHQTGKSSTQAGKRGTQAGKSSSQVWKSATQDAGWDSRTLAKKVVPRYPGPGLPRSAAVPPAVPWPWSQSLQLGHCGCLEAALCSSLPDTSRGFGQKVELHPSVVSESSAGRCPQSAPSSEVFPKSFLSELGAHLSLQSPFCLPPYYHFLLLFPISPQPPVRILGFASPQVPAARCPVLAVPRMLKGCVGRRCLASCTLLNCPWLRTVGRWGCRHQRGCFNGGLECLGLVPRVSAAFQPPPKKALSP